MSFLGTYEKARYKARKAESDSDLSTTDVDQRKRKRRQIIYSSSDDDGNNNVLSFVKEPRK